MRSMASSPPHPHHVLHNTTAAASSPHGPLASAGSGGLLLADMTVRGAAVGQQQRISPLNPSLSGSLELLQQQTAGATNSNEHLWLGNAQHMAEIVDLFSRANSTDNAVQQQLARAFQTLRELPDAPCYLTAILVCPDYPSEVRQLAGLTLKSNLQLQHQQLLLRHREQQQQQLQQPRAAAGGSAVPPPPPLLPSAADVPAQLLPAAVLAYVRPQLLRAVADADKCVRQAAGSAMATLLSLEGIAAWPQALQQLLLLLSDTREDVVDGAFSALEKICEDALLLQHAPSSTASSSAYSSSSSTLDEEVFAQFALSHLLPQLFRLALPPAALAVRKKAVACLTHFVQRRAFATQEPYEVFFSRFWELLGQLAHEPDPDLRRFVVQGMMQVVDTRPEAVFHSVASGDAVLDFIIRCCSDSDYRLRLEALEFWPVLLRDVGPQQPLHEYQLHAVQLLRGRLQQLLPILVKNTRYHELDYLGMDPSQLQDDNAAVADVAADLKPRFHRSSQQLHTSCSGLESSRSSSSTAAVVATTRGGGSGAVVGSAAAAACKAAGSAVAAGHHHVTPAVAANPTGADRATTDEQQQQQHRQGRDASQDRSNTTHILTERQLLLQQQQPQLDGDEEDDEEEDARGTWGDGWTVRKGSALALDHVASVYREEILPQVLPLIEASLADSDWEIRESAVLTLGALAQGCQEKLEPYLPTVLDYLLKLCDDPKPLLRSISCWCVSRYAAWVCSQEERYLQAVLAQILKHVLDCNKRVQEAACSAFATIEEEAGQLLLPFLADIVAALQRALHFYQAKNLLILYDAVGTLADRVGMGLRAQPQLAKKLLEPLCARWQAIQSLHDHSLIGLLECITNLAAALGDDVAPFAQPVTERCVTLLAQCIAETDRFEKGELSERPSRDLMESCLDLLSGLTEALGPQMKHLLLQQPQLNFVSLLQRCCQDRSAGMLQSSFALVGDFSKHCVEFLEPHLDTILPILAASLLHHATSVQNNAGWAIGELALRAKHEYIDRHCDSICDKLISIIRCPQLHRSLLQNVCISLGRLALVCALRLAVHLGEFLQQWCLIMRGAKNDEEKANGFQGICLLIEINPEPAARCLADVVVSMLAFQPCPEKLNQKFTLVLQALSQKYVHEWRSLYEPQADRPCLPPPLLQALEHRFLIAAPVGVPTNTALVGAAAVAASGGGASAVVGAPVGGDVAGAAGGAVAVRPTAASEMLEASLAHNSSSQLI